MSEKDLAQFKLTNGSEVVCEIMEWPDNDDNQMIVRNVMTILTMEYQDGDRAYQFRPWIQFLDGDKDYVIMNSEHIISINKPSEYLTDQYFSAVNETHQNAKARRRAHKKDKLEGLKRVAEAMERVLRKKQEEPEELEYEDNIIYFPSNDDDPKVH